MSSQQKTLHQQPGSHPQQIKPQSSLQDRRSRVTLGQHAPSPPGTDAPRTPPASPGTLAGLYPSQVHGYGCHRGHGRPLSPSPSSGLAHKARPILLRNAGQKDEATTQAPGSSNDHLFSACSACDTLCAEVCGERDIRHPCLDTKCKLGKQTCGLLQQPLSKRSAFTRRPQVNSSRPAEGAVNLL